MFTVLTSLTQVDWSARLWQVICKETGKIFKKLFHFKKRQAEFEGGLRMKRIINMNHQQMHNGLRLGWLEIKHRCTNLGSFSLLTPTKDHGTQMKGAVAYSGARTHLHMRIPVLLCQNGTRDQFCRHEWSFLIFFIALKCLIEFFSSILTLVPTNFLTCRYLAFL